MGGIAYRHVRGHIEHIGNRHVWRPSAYSRRLGGVFRHTHRLVGGPRLQAYGGHTRHVGRGPGTKVTYR